MAQPPLLITFVCMGNICRSPTAHGVFRQMVRDAGLAQQVRVDSVGTHDYHVGAPPDPRSQHAAARRGYDLSDLRARALEDADFERSTLLLAMDWDNFALTRALCPDDRYLPKVRRLTEFCRKHRAEVVADPYSGGPAGFERTLDLVEDACDGLLVHVWGKLRATGWTTPTQVG
ncbi:MAG: low molecular weight phosphotyrosine protein phosphatase [Burkholderiaceae bacterium]|nr:low molecular weight phosphotyrosine protein phosphatase [Burkholderiaceae bacterium]